MTDRRHIGYRPVAVSLFLIAFAICGVRQTIAQSQAVEFDVDAVCMKAQDDDARSRVDLYVRVPYANLGFEPSSRGFVARYRVGAEITRIGANGLLGNKVENPVWDRTVRVANHAQTGQTDLSDLTTHSLLLPPGDYLVGLSVVDESTGDALAREIPLRVREFTDAVALSDLLLLDDYDPERNVITPSVSERFGTERLGFSLMYEVYLDRPRTVKISRQVFQTSNSLTGDEADAPLPLATEARYEDDHTNYIEALRSQHVVTIPISDFQLGQYLVRVILQDAAGDTLDMAEEPFTVDWKGLADHIHDVDDAIAQLVYIAKPKEIRHMKDGKTGAERLSRFVDFWRRRDPTPGTRRNERMEEYYYRVSHANERYGTLTDGWKTDRGQVIVLFGEPDYIERHPYNFNVEPYEVWYYYRIGKRFIFVDRTGLGDYEILIPIWDERTRIR